MAVLKLDGLGIQAEKSVRASLLHDIAGLELMEGHWAQAEVLQTEAVGIRSVALGGPDHPSTLTSVANLASTYSNQGRLKEAESLDVKVMETNLTVLGPDHPNTLTSMNDLAYTWMAQGLADKAFDLMNQCVQVSNSCAGSRVS